MCYSFIFSSEKVLIGEVVDKVIEGGGRVVGVEQSFISHK